MRSFTRLPKTGPFSLGLLASWIAFGGWNPEPHAAEQAAPVPTLLGLRGELLVDDDGTLDRGGKEATLLNGGARLRANLGKWNRSPDDERVWRSTWTKEMGHTPVAAYLGWEEQNLIAEVTFRFGAISESWQHQCFRIAFDQRPEITGHIVSAWANPNNDFIETGFLLQHIRKTPEKEILQDLLLDRQPLSLEPERWYTAILEVVDDEALFRLGDHLAYAKSGEIARPKNLVSLTTGTTWHEIRRVRIWKATRNPNWERQRRKIIAGRQPFKAGPHRYQRP